MALDLFANFERQSNNPLFYRTVSVEPYNFTVKLSNLQGDVDYPLYLTQNYVAKYSLNGDINSSTEFSFLTGVNLSFNRTLPCLSSVQIYLYAATGEEELPLVETYAISASFVPSFPQIDFVAFPSTVFDGAAKLTLSPRTYELSKGVYFYGEGHSEVIYLSANNVYNNEITWNVGPFLNELDNPSKFSISDTGDVQIKQFTATSSPKQDEKIPINLRLSNLFIKQNGPVVRYDDVTGAPSFYPFFTSTLTVNNQHDEQSSIYKQSLHIKPYPTEQSYAFGVKPFNSTTVLLSSDFNSRYFTASLNPKSSDLSFVEHQLINTEWSVKAKADSISNEGSWSYTSAPLANITTYKFPLAYEKSSQEITPVFKVSSINSTTVTLEVTANKLTKIDYPPYDWEPRNVKEAHSDSTFVMALPQIKLYAGNYFNLADVPVNFQVVYPNEDLYRFQRGIVFSDTGSVSISSWQTNFNLTFEKIGLQSLTAISTFESSTSREIVTVATIFPNMIEVLNNFDIVVDSKYYKAEKTPFVINQAECPLISPKDWAVEDTINSVLMKLYNTIEEFKNSIFSYSTTSFLYGWLGEDTFKWKDLECNSETSNNTQWEQNTFASGFDQNDNGFPVLWAQQECDNILIDPTCLQKYCLEWKWNKRQKKQSKIFTTWRSSKLGNEYEKKWKYEPCEVDSERLNCGKGRWHMSTIDANSFPIPYCSNNETCSIQGCLTYTYPDKTTNLIFAHKTEINVYNNSYVPKILDRRGNADGIFNFANIQAMDIEAENGILFVLDSLLPRVCSYKLTSQGLVLQTSWGKYGLGSNPYGFNKPNDLHVDRRKRVWVVDSGNKYIKVYSISGKFLFSLKEQLEDQVPMSVCLDSDENAHVLFTSKKIGVYNTSNLEKIANYELSSEITPTTIRPSYNKEILYVTHKTGVLKYFKTGSYYGPLIENLTCANGDILQNYNSVFQDKYRNILVSVGSKLLHLPDRMKIDLFDSTALGKVYWQTDKIKIGKEEFIQPWVYIRAFHRLWDNIELVRNMLVYSRTKDQSYLKPVFNKQDLTIGQNEIVTNAVINRISNQIWSNIQTMLLYLK